MGGGCQVLFHTLPLMASLMKAGKWQRSLQLPQAQWWHSQAASCPPADGTYLWKCLRGGWGISYDLQHNPKHSYALLRLFKSLSLKGITLSEYYLGLTQSMVFYSCVTWNSCLFCFCCANGTTVRWFQCSIFSLSQNLRAAREVHQYDRDVDDLKGWIQEKEAVVDREEYGYDLSGVQTLLSQHERLEVSRTKCFETPAQIKPIYILLYERPNCVRVAAGSLTPFREH